MLVEVLEVLGSLFDEFSYLVDVLISDPFFFQIPEAFKLLPKLFTDLELPATILLKTTQFKNVLNAIAEHFKLISECFNSLLSLPIDVAIYQLFLFFGTFMHLL